MADWKDHLNELCDSIERLVAAIQNASAPGAYTTGPEGSPDNQPIDAAAEALRCAIAALERSCPTWGRELWKDIAEGLARWSTAPLVTRPEVRQAPLLRKRADEWAELGRELGRRLRALPASGTAGPVGRAAPPAEAKYLFRPEGDSFLIAFGGAPFRLPVATGLFYVRHLLGNPGKSMRVLELKTTVERAPVSRDEHRAEAAFHRRRKELKQRLEILKRLDPTFERSEAELSAILREQRELDDQLRRSARVRTLTGELDLARQTVSQAIDRSLDEIRRHDVTLADHLARNLQIGTYCRYTPADPVTWRT